MIAVDVNDSYDDIGTSVVVLITSPVPVSVTEIDELPSKDVSKALPTVAVRVEDMRFSVIVLTASPMTFSVTEISGLLIGDVFNARSTVVVTTEDITRLSATNKKLVVSNEAISDLSTASSRDVLEVGKSIDEVSGARARGSLRVKKPFPLDKSVSRRPLVAFAFGISVADSELSIVVVNMLLVVFRVVTVEELVSELEDNAVHFPLTSISAFFGTVACCAGKVNVHSFSSLMLLTPRSDNRR